MKLVSASVIATLCCVPVAANAGLIANGGFEDPVAFNVVQQAFFSPGTTVGNPGAWIAVGDAGTDVVVLKTTYPEPQYSVTEFNAHSGSAAIDLTGSLNQGMSTGVKETVATTAGLSYHLSFWVGTATTTLAPGAPSGYYDPATVNLLINGAAAGSFTNAHRTTGFVNWEQFSYDFVAAGSSTLITFLNGTPGNASGVYATSGSWYAGLDDVDLNVADISPVPAPGALMLALTALPSLAIVCGRRQGT